ncbi:MAG TPA: tetratricopeptide repeat protein [Thermodesulfobacteriota bacterium]|nr:tetratricopeptide repeat protein [Thermodesulfobacteriota bacterium]
MTCKRSWLLIALFCFLLTACSLPRIYILKDPLTPDEHINLGVAYERRGELDEAVKQYGLAAKKTPRAFLYLGNAYFQKGEWKKAEENYRLAIRKIPGEADAYNNLAWLYFTRNEKLGEAEELARKAMALNPGKEAEYRDTLENILERRKQPGKEPGEK